MAGGRWVKSYLNQRNGIVNNTSSGPNRPAAAIGGGIIWDAGQARKGNFQKTVYITVFTTWRPIMYSTSEDCETFKLVTCRVRKPVIGSSFSLYPFINPNPNPNAIFRRLTRASYRRPSRVSSARRTSPAWSASARGSPHTVEGIERKNICRSGAYRIDK